MSRKQRIKRTLKQSDSPLATNEVADQADIAWYTAHDDLEDLHDAEFPTVD